jgi:uncharacterized protein (TIGR04255 family)
MKLPRKISPDRIKDAIVEIRYLTKIPFEVAVGMFYQSLDESFTYTNRPFNRQNIPASFPVNLPQEITLSLGGQSLFYNDKIKVQLQPNSIIFNCLNEYISWEKYKPEIERVLTQFSMASVIDSYQRIGVRYISEYPNIDLTKCVKFSFSFGMPNVISETYTFHSEFNWESIRVILNLNNKLPILNQRIPGQNTTTSLIDIDAILENIDRTDIDGLLEDLDRVHLKQKEIFFNLLNESFLQTLNPEY